MSILNRSDVTRMSWQRTDCRSWKQLYVSLVFLPTDMWVLRNVGTGAVTKCSCMGFFVSLFLDFDRKYFNFKGLHYCQREAWRIRYFSLD